MLKIVLLALSILIVVISLLLLWMAKGIQSTTTSVVEVQETNASSEALTDTSTLSIMTWNIAWAYGFGSEGSGKLKSEEQMRANLDSIAQTISESNADVVLLQEVDFDSDRSYRVNQANYLAEKAGYRFVVPAVSWSANYLPFPYWPLSEHWKAMSSGGAIISRIPLKNCRVQLLPKPKSQSFVYRLFYLFRYLQACDLEFWGKTVSIYNTHLEAFDISNREEQMQLAVSAIKKGKSQLRIFGGDFNTVSNDAKLRHNYPDEPETDHRNDKTLQILQDGLDIQDTALMSVPPQHTGLFTFPAHVPNRKLDYIFVEPQMKVESLATVNSAEKASDHLPLLLRLSVN